MRRRDWRGGGGACGARRPRRRHHGRGRRLCGRLPLRHAQRVQARALRRARVHHGRRVRPVSRRRHSGREVRLDQREPARRARGAARPLERGRRPQGDPRVLQPHRAHRAWRRLLRLRAAQARVAALRALERARARRRRPPRLADVDGRRPGRHGGGHARRQGGGQADWRHPHRARGGDHPAAPRPRLPPARLRGVLPLPLRAQARAHRRRRPHPRLRAHRIHHPARRLGHARRNLRAHDPHAAPQARHALPRPARLHELRRLLRLAPQPHAEHDGRRHRRSGRVQRDEGGQDEPRMPRPPHRILRPLRGLCRDTTASKCSSQRLQPTLHGKDSTLIISLVHQRQKQKLRLRVSSLMTLARVRQLC
mmetsp:Transcript_16008/g.52398  ORF Transcript_16008/g.52398 Transcript_16008/m.52398 type:complete len:366 (+) Transcript_16008:832-1929(+)